MKKVIGIGNALVDVLNVVENEEILKECNFPKGSMTLVWDAPTIEKMTNAKAVKKEIRAGGSAANTIYGLANLGVEAGFIASIGEDEFGQIFKSELEKSGIETKMKVCATPSGRAIAFVTPDAERTFGVCLGAAIELTPEDLSADMFAGYDIMHIEGYLVQNHALITRAAELAKSQGLKISLDMASYNVVEENLEFLKDYIKKFVDIVFANEEEAKAFTGKEPEEALLTIKEMCELAIVKLGMKGSIVKSDNEIVTIPIIKANCIDTTGAGDFYAAGFLTGLIQGESLTKCGNMGAILAGKVIEEIGAKISDENWIEVKKMIAELK
jgi:sugar/nucleoside kinase (ribokinase family)